MKSLKSKPNDKKDQCLLLVSIFICKPTATSATGVTVFPILKKEFCNASGNSSENSVQQSAIVKAINGGNFTIFNTISEVLKLPLEKLAATKIPKVVTTTNEPGWSTMIAVFNPSAPYKASIIGNPTKEVLLNPPVKIKQPINFFDHLKYVPKV